jgi:hypothetical protein
MSMTVSRPEETPHGSPMSVFRAPAPLIDPPMTISGPKKTVIDRSMAVLGAPETLERGSSADFPGS